MQIEGEININAPRAVVWKALNDPDVLRQCIEGCESLERVSDTEMTGRVTARVGPVKASFTGAVTLTNIVPEQSYTLNGEGKGGVAGFAKGSADVRLEDADPGQTRLVYAARANVGGKLAQLGARLIESTAKSYADKFFDQFGQRVGQPESVAPPTPADLPPAPAMEPGAAVPAWLWIALLVAAAVGLLVYQLA